MAPTKKKRPSKATPTPSSNTKALAKPTASASSVSAASKKSKPAVEEKKEWGSQAVFMLGEDEKDDDDEEEEEERKGGRSVIKVVQKDEEEEEDERFAGAKAKMARIAELMKRKGLEVQEDDDDEEEDEENMMEGDEEDEEDFKDDDDDDDALNDESHLLPGEQTDILGLADPTPNPKPTAVKPITLTTLQTFNARLDRTGVCYLSRIPPFMKPQALRHLLSQHGTIGRIYLAPEDPKVTARRKKYKGNRRVNFVEGWVEFEDKKLGRRAAEFLNGRNVGGKKTGRFYDDLWSIRYLPRFKWHHLTDQIAYERAVRDQKLRAEMSAVKRENKGYLRNVAKNKMIQAIEARKAKQLLEKDTGEKVSIFDKKRPAENVDGGEVKKARKEETEASKKYNRTFRQRAPVNVGVEAAEPSERQVGMLKKVFGKRE